MKKINLNKLVSLRLWGGLYLFSYGIGLEATYSATLYSRPFQTAHELVALCFTIALSWKFSNVTKPFVKYAWPVVFIISAGALAVGFYFLPWFIPTYTLESEFGWPEHQARAINSAYRIALIIAGVCLLTLYFRSVLQRVEPKDESERLTKPLLTRKQER